MKEIIYNIDGVAGRVITLTGLTGTFTKNNVLGIINKSQGDVLYTPMDWNMLTFAYSNGTMTLTLAESVAAIVSGDKLFIKLYTDEEGSSGDAAELVKDFFHIVKDGDTVKVITEDGGEEVVVPVELATEQEVKDINDDVIGALYGYGKVAVTIHSLMRIGTAQNSENAQDSESAQNYITQDLASVIYVDPSKTWAENGYPTLYDDEGEPIDTTTNPAAGDEVFNYQIQSES